jgi:predicted ATP-binding protein involved in virulence
MRHLQKDTGLLRAMDYESVRMDSSGTLIGPMDPRRIIPSFQELLSEYNESAYSREVSKAEAEIFLTPRIEITKTNGVRLLLHQLSDGEQRIFSLLVDITRQLSLIAPMPPFRIQDMEAVILIDEIDVHLHPKWQRMIVPALEDLFPSCQIIATTHSPFVVQAVREENVQHLDHALHGDFTSRGIEEIAFTVMGIEDHQVSHRYLEMLDTAKKYFHLLGRAKAIKNKKSDELERLKSDLGRLSQHYARNPAYQAYLELHEALALGPEELK